MAKDTEIEAMEKVKDAFESLTSSKEAQQRVLNWIIERFDLKAITPTISQPSHRLQTNEKSTASSGKYSDLAENSDSLGFILHFSDIKAKNKKDAFNRFSIVIPFLYELTTNERTVPWKSIFLPLLQDWRLYDTNTSAYLKNVAGLKEKDGEYYLDRPAKMEAAKILDEILDDSKVGAWKPSLPKKQNKQKD